MPFDFRQDKKCSYETLQIKFSHNTMQCNAEKGSDGQNVKIKHQCDNDFTCMLS